MNRGLLSIFGVAVFFAILFGSLTLETIMAAPAEKELVCHSDPDDDGVGLETIEVKDNPKTIEKHEAHGDHVGKCFVCGDGFIDPPTETCDDGEDNGYPGFCNATCDGIQPHVCGDGITSGSEECDDSNTVTEECAYGQMSCTVCSDNCTEQPGATSYCGDRAITGQTITDLDTRVNDKQTNSAL